MRLSEIVAYRNRLNEIEVDSVRDQAQYKLDAVQHIVTEHEIQLGAYSNDIQEKFTNVTQSFNQFAEVLNDLKAELDSLIQQRQGEYFAESSRLYENEMCWETNEYILNRRLHIDDDSNVILRSRVRSYTDWRVPGMIIRPGRETFIEDLVPLDPLYVVDHHQELIEPALEGFNDAYRARLRTYVIDEGQVNILEQLPNGQFGFIFIYNYFNFKPMELIKRYLKELYQKLRPGGVVIMTYNDCDRAHGVALAEQSFMCYTPGSHIRDSAEASGFDITHQHTGLGDLTWIELQRPGDITSLRGGQPLARIVPK
jgi:SAM-dependent methyltransferase